MAILIVFPEGDVSDDRRQRAWTGCWRSPCIAIAWTDIALAALAYHHDVGVDRARALDRRAVDDQHRRLRCLVLSFRRGDGLIIAYVFSMVAALIAALIPLVRCYGMPHGWKPDLADRLEHGACATCPLAAADAVEWASRRIDLAVLGAFMPASFVGIYYVAQQVATLPAKLKTSFEPVLGPAIVRKHRGRTTGPAIAKQVRQVTYWIIAAQLGIALALGIPGRAVMGLVGLGLHRRHRDARLPARRRSHRRGRGRQRSGADLRRAQAQHGDQPGHAGARGGACRGA